MEKSEYFNHIPKEFECLMIMGKSETWCIAQSADMRLPGQNADLTDNESETDEPEGSDQAGPSHRSILRKCPKFIIFSPLYLLPRLGTDLLLICDGTFYCASKGGYLK